MYLREAGRERLELGGLTARFADSDAEVRACQRLRHVAFRGGPGLEADGYDARAAHLMVLAGAEVMACVRVFEHGDVGAAQAGYSGQFYDLSGLAAFRGPLIEIGRLCLRDAAGADALRLLWGALTRIVERRRARMVFGCTSFAGVGPADHGGPFARLAQAHLAPPAWRPGRGGGETVALMGHGEAGEMPQLLRAYLGMGARVGDHGVIDREMGTIHVFTGLDLRDVPKGRARVLRRLAAGGASR